MPTEVRKLIFTLEELTQPLLRHCADAGIHIPPAPLQEVLVEGKTPPRVILRFVDADPEAPFEKRVSEDIVLSAMVSICNDEGIPLPRHAQKYAQDHEGGFAMIVGLGNRRIAV